ncbi:hypothetical protein D3C78_861690 [compost metagenome]
MLQGAVRQAELQGHAARALAGIRRLRVAAAEGEARHNRHRLAGEQCRARILRRFRLADELADRAGALGVIASLTLGHPEDLLEGADHLVGCHIVVGGERGADTAKQHAGQK